jgi:hypothetical protein
VFSFRSSAFQAGFALRQYFAQRGALGIRTSDFDFLALRTSPFGLSGKVMSSTTLQSLRTLFAPSDEQLMWRVQTTDDHGAFASLVQRWEEPIRRLCARLTGDLHRAEDLAQEIFARLFAHRQSFRQDPNSRPTSGAAREPHAQRTAAGEEPPRERPLGLARRRHR